MDNPFLALERETYRLVKVDESVHQNLKSQGVKGSVVKFYRQDIDFAVSDTLERDLPHGRTETWRIDEVDFKSEFHGIPAHYVLTVSNVARPKKEPAPQIVTYYLYGTNSRVNHHSSDHSHNTVQIDASNLFARVEQVLTQAVSNQEELQALQRQLAQMQAMRGQSTFAQSYVEFMSLAADHLTVLTPFLPALAQLLVFAGQAH